jgi:4-hydroxybenzoyl-CoA reductase subunit beta
MEYMPNFRLHRPTTVAEAVKIRASEPGSFFVAGGTDLIVNIRRGIEQAKALVDLSAIEDLHSISVDDDGIHIGAAVNLEILANHEAVTRDFAAVAAAACAVAGPTHRAYGTLGGNLCLDTRCLYYNQSEWWRQSNDYCLKERGSVCHVAPGGSFCFAAFSGDVAPAMLVHEAEIDLVGPQGTRRIPLNDFYNNDGQAHLAKQADELLTVVHLPKTTAGVASGYEKARVRGSIDFPLAGVAVALRLVDGKVDTLRVALTGVNPRPLLIEKTKYFFGKPLDDAALDKLRELVRSQSKPMRTTTVKPWYRRRVVGNLARRLTTHLAG